MLIVFEGIDGSGKSTQVELLATALRDQGFSVVTSREPTLGKHGRAIRAAAATRRLPPMVELTHFILDRQEHVKQLIQPALDSGQIVILDRYFLSSAAYQGSRLGTPQRVFQQMQQLFPNPDLAFILDVDVECATRRIMERSNVTADQFEQRETLAVCREIFQRFSGWSLRHLNGMLPASDIHQAVLDEVVHLLRWHAPKFSERKAMPTTPR